MNASVLPPQMQRSPVGQNYSTQKECEITNSLLDGEWLKVEKRQKIKHTDLARPHTNEEEVHMKANPDFKWREIVNVSHLNDNNNFKITNDNCISNQCNEQRDRDSLNHLEHSRNNKDNIQQSHKNIIENYNNNYPSSQDNKYNSAAQFNPYVESLAQQSMQKYKDLSANQHYYYPSSNIMDINLTNVRQQQLEAPKPPKKRFLERNDSIYSSNEKIDSTSQRDSNSNSNSHGMEIAVPCISLDQDILDRVIDKAFSEEPSGSSGSNSNSNNRPSSNSCKFSDRNPIKPTVSLSNNHLTSSTFSTIATNSSSTSYPMSVDEPVDFSMNRTINATRQQIINNLVEKMLSEPTDDRGSSYCKLNGNDGSSRASFQGPPASKDKSDAAR